MRNNIGPKFWNKSLLGTIIIGLDDVGLKLESAILQKIMIKKIVIVDSAAPWLLKYD